MDMNIREIRGGEFRKALGKNPKKLRENTVKILKQARKKSLEEIPQITSAEFCSSLR